MRSYCTLSAGVALAGALVCALASGCGESELMKPPAEASAGPPPMTSMPGYDPVTKQMKTAAPPKAAASRKGKAMLPP